MVTSQPQRVLSEDDLRKQLEQLDVDFGYAVGNLGTDCKDDTVERILALFTQQPTSDGLELDTILDQIGYTKNTDSRDDAKRRLTEWARRNNLATSDGEVASSECKDETNVGESVRNVLIRLRHGDPDKYPELRTMPDPLIEKAMQLIAADKRNSETLLKADLSWCLGKLRGLGHPAEHLEDKYLLHPTEPINKEES